MAKPTLTIDRATRDVLRDEIRLDTPDLAIALRNGDRSAAMENLDRTQVCCALLEDLGWEERDDRDRFEITMDPSALTRWLRRQQELAEGGLRDNLESLAQQEAGEEGHFYCDRNQQQSIELSRGYVERDERELRVISSLLECLDESLAVA